MTPKRTAPPVARMLAERPAAPPLLPLELLVEVGVEPEPEGLLLVREDKWDATLEALDLTEDNEETMEEEEAGRIKSASITQESRQVCIQPQRAASMAAACWRSAAVQLVVRHV